MILRMFHNDSVDSLKEDDASVLDPMPSLGDSKPLSPLIDITPQQAPKDDSGNLVQNPPQQHQQPAPAAPMKIDLKSLADSIPTPITMLEKSCTSSDVMGVLIDQINGLQNDIRNLEMLRDTLRNNFLADQKAWRSTYAVDNKIKTFSGFYSTILNYKTELNKMLVQLKNILSEGNSVSEQIKEAIKEALLEQTVQMRDDAAMNKKRIEELLKDSPGLMPRTL